MASTTPNTTGVIRYSEAEIDQKFEELRRKIPGLENFKRSSTALSVLLDLSNCHEQMLGILRDGFSDVCIPFWQGTIPNTLAPSRFNNIIQLQERFLLDYLPIPQGAERGKHFRLSNNHLQRDYNNPSLVPRGLKVVKTIGKGGYGFVDAVEDTSTRSQFALKRITRDADPKRSAEQLRYVTLELNALKKIRDQPTGGIHFVELVCGFTDPMFYGILMEPLADCNLDEFLQTFASTPQRDESLLATWYGCLATALAYLHFNLRIRHKDIKPQNILVIGRNVVFTDFGMALDWSESGQTTTNQEKLLSPRYAAPETDRDEPRNSSADIWPLGCVFLEMTAASKGWTRQDLDHFLMNPGSTVMRYVKNIKGIKDVIEELRRRQSRYGNAPLEWVEKMLQVDARSRPTARTLRSMIFESETAHCQLFCGICCRSMPWLPSTSVNSGPALGAILSEPQV
jgi:serine/threonine protein kinase